MKRSRDAGVEDIPLVRTGTVRRDDRDGAGVRVNLFVLTLARRDAYFSDDPP
jgi:hypothetical protein